jgi:hypothetical protein
MSIVEPRMPETDASFPTGVQLSFSEGVISGAGHDWVGPFTIEGNYDVSNGHCSWQKHYIGSHSVYYQGSNELKGIWGVWEINILGGLYHDQGLFHIWPEGMSLATEDQLRLDALPESVAATRGRVWWGGIVRLAVAWGLVAAAAAALSLVHDRLLTGS